MHQPELWRKKLYSGYYGCNKYTQKGKSVNGQVENFKLRSNEQYRMEITAQEEIEGVAPVSHYADKFFVNR